MGIARLKAMTGELVDIRFATYFSGTPGGGGVASTKATDIHISLTVPPDRPHPDSVLVKLHAEDLYGTDREFHVTLEPTGERSYSGQLDDHLVIMTTGPGRPLRSKEQGIEVVLIRGADSENLIDPVMELKDFKSTWTGLSSLTRPQANTSAMSRKLLVTN